MVKLKCGCHTTPRKAAFMNWLLKKAFTEAYKGHFRVSSFLLNVWDWLHSTVKEN